MHQLSRRAAALSLLLACPALSQTAAQTAANDRGTTIAVMGGALAERMQHHGWFETALQFNMPGINLRVRHLGFGADELTVHQRTMNFGKFTDDGMAMTLANERFVPWDRYLDHVDAEIVVAMFGYNESFAGAEGLDEFEEDLRSFIRHVLAQKYDEDDAPRLYMTSSIPHEDLADPNLPDGREHNRRIELYNARMAEVCEAEGASYVDIYTPMAAAYAASDAPLTINGIHLNEAGNRVLGETLADTFLREQPRTREFDTEAVRAAVIEKDLMWFHRYRATDGYNVYGGRSRQVYTASVSGEKFPNFDVLQRELEVLDAIARNGDERVWALASGEDVEFQEELPTLIDVETNKLGDGPDGAHRYLGGEQAISQMTPAPGMEVTLFADEKQFPDLVNPVQMAWDPAGRLWVLAWPSYPRWTVGDPMADKILVFEDTDGDGRADKQTTFADDLVNPTGIEFWNGGVFVACCPDLIFLKDTDGDGKADYRESVLHGLSSGDTHHSANSFVLGPDGALYFQEGTFHQSQVESIYGPIRNHNGCVWRYEPRTHRVERYIPYNYANPHGHVFDDWGQDFMTDGTGNVNYYALAFSGHLDHPDKHRGYFSFFKQRSRPCAATEILSSRAFPEANQGAYLVANVIGFRGIFQYEVVDDGSGFGAVEMDPIVHSTDLNFRPADIEVGPDGAIYFLDWHNAIIGHLQHHIRDPSRDAEHGRIYRVTYEGYEPLKREPIAGQPIAKVLESLKSPEYRTRYAARIELSGRDSDEVIEAARRFQATLDPEDPNHTLHLMEILWLHQQHNRMDRVLLERMLTDSDPRARAAATRVLRYGRQHVSDALTLLHRQAADAHPRVRLEALVAASFFREGRAATVALEILRHPRDKFLDYALGETMRSLEPFWRESLRNGEVVAVDNPEGLSYLLDRVGPEELEGLPRVEVVLEALLTRRGIDLASRRDAAIELAGKRDSTVSAELFRAVERLDAGSSEHAAHILHDLGSLLSELQTGGELLGTGNLADIATSARRSPTRELGFALWIRESGDILPIYETARRSTKTLDSFLGAIGHLGDPDLTRPITPDVRGLMYALPSHIQASLGSAGGGSGMKLSYFSPPPKNARLETLKAMTPKEVLTATEFGLKLPKSRPDAFGLLFEGMVFLPESGEYTFFINSDDGSRLYINGEQLIENDGSHGMRERSGKVTLTTGAHAIVVTYYDQGGGEGLVVSWKGPGFAKQAIPASAIGNDPALAIRARAIAACAHLPISRKTLLEDAARLIGEGALLAPATELLRGAQGGHSGAHGPQAPEDLTDAIHGVVDSLAAHVAGLGNEGRTSPEVLAALESARELTGRLPEDQRADAQGRLEGLGGSVVLVRTMPHQMLYDVTEFWVEAGSPVSVVFQNNDVMPHNLVFTDPGMLTAIGIAAEAMATDPNASAKNFVPNAEGVRWSLPLVSPGESARVTFEAPSVGSYPFVCTYPGHWRVMNGVMHVVEDLDGPGRVSRRSVAEGGGSGHAAARPFVKDWTLDDLAPLLADGWDQNRDTGRGKELFHELGCAKCHVAGTEGAIGGPDLTKISEKYQGTDLLRHILEPSSELLDGYQFTIFVTDSGIPVTGRIVSEDDEGFEIVTALLNPDDLTFVYKDEIEERIPSKLSPMPSGLLVTLNESEILDLLAYLSENK